MGFLYLTANAIATTYLLENDILLTKGQLLTLQAWIRSISFLTAVLLFLALFLFLLGEKMAYLREIIQGVEALRTHRMDFTMPIEGNNELTELAESINFLSETERRLRHRETALRAEKEQLIRDLSHDIRTPLTAMLSYSDYWGQKETLEQEEMRRIFDNLASNVEKYADREQPVELWVDAVDKRLRICQRNGIKADTVPVESNQIFRIL